MSKQFCPSCGNSTLIKTSVSIDEAGVLHYHLKKNFQYRLKGTKAPSFFHTPLSLFSNSHFLMFLHWIIFLKQYSIPPTKGGKHNSDLILREDQKEYEQALKNSRRKKNVDIFDPDYVPAFQEGKNSQKPNVKIGYGRKNPNEPKQSKRRK